MTVLLPDMKSSMYGLSFSLLNYIHIICHRTLDKTIAPRNQAELQKSRVGQVGGGEGWLGVGMTE